MCMYVCMRVRLRVRVRVCVFAQQLRHNSVRKRSYSFIVLPLRVRDSSDEPTIGLHSVFSSDRC